jgi:hypothetical protein
MSQLTIATQIPGGVTDPRGTRRRRTRNARMVTLRSSLPTGLVTLRHDIPEYLPEFLEETTPKVEDAEREILDTPVGKGGEAQW